MKDLNIFQIVLLIGFGFLGIFGVLVFAGVIPLGGDSVNGFGGEVRLWGTLPSTEMAPIIADFNNRYKDEFVLIYEEIDKSSYESKFVNALAGNEGPDLLFFPQEFIYKHKNKVAIIREETYSKRKFLDTFIEEGSLFLDSEGIIAIPFLVDPLVTYWNRDLYQSASVAKPPKIWGEFLSLGEKLTVSDKQANITQSAVALGVYNNISNAKEILSAMIIQTGNNIVERQLKEGREIFKNILTSPAEGPAAALRFFVQFSNPSKSLYSWNRSMKNSFFAFSDGILATYFGAASEYPKIKSSNPHLNFDVAILPQRDAEVAHKTFGRLYALGITRNGGNRNTAFRVAVALSEDKESLKKISEVFYLVPASLSALEEGHKDPIIASFYKSAIISEGWVDPSMAETNNILNDLVEKVLTGKETEEGALTAADARLRQLLQ